MSSTVSMLRKTISSAASALMSNGGVNARKGVVYFYVSVLKTIKLVVLFVGVRELIVTTLSHPDLTVPRSSA